LIVPPALEGKAREILNAQLMIGIGTGSEAVSNIWQGSADLLVVPELA
jgi:Mu-like prophage major head subunit gpT